MQKKKLVIFLILYKVIKNLFVVINIILSNAKAKCFKNTSKHYKTEVYFSSALQFKWVSQVNLFLFNRPNVDF